MRCDNASTSGAKFGKFDLERIANVQTGRVANEIVNVDS